MVKEYYAAHTASVIWKNSTETFHSSAQENGDKVEASFTHTTKTHRKRHTKMWQVARWKTTSQHKVKFSPNVDTRCATAVTSHCNCSHNRSNNIAFYSIHQQH